MLKDYMRISVSITQTEQEVLGLSIWNLSLLELLQIKVCSDSLFSAF